MYQIVPALLTYDFDTFRLRLKAVEPYFSLVQLDIADGEFVPNKNFADPTLISKIKTPAHYELHLMVAHPMACIEDWKDVPNVARITFHVESADDPREVIERILFYGFDVGVALNPETPISAIEPYLGRVETVLFLGVHPGRSGAPFIPETVEKIRNFSHVMVSQSNYGTDVTLRQAQGDGLRTRGDTLQVRDGIPRQRPKIAVDGGVSHETIPALKAAGATVFCMSSELFEKHATVKEALDELRQLLP